MGIIRLTGATIDVSDSDDSEHGGRWLYLRHGGDTYTVHLPRAEKSLIGLQLLSDEIEAVRAALKQHDEQTEPE